MIEHKSSVVRNALVLVVVILLLAVSITYITGTGPFRSNSASTTSGSSQTSTNATFTTNLYYSIAINYSGSWNLEYWGQNGTYGPQEKPIPGLTDTPYDISANQSGSGNFKTTIVTYVVGYGENTLCAEATKTDSQNLTLTLTIINQSNSTTVSDPTTEVCFVFGVGF